MSWLKRERTGIKRRQKPERAEVPEGLWTKCDGCGEALFQSVLEEHLWTCPKCEFHFRVPARTYLRFLADEGSFDERDANLVSGDPLEFRDAKMKYPDRLAVARRETGMNDAVLSGVATVGGKQREDFSDLAGRWKPDPAFDEILAAQRQIDWDQWK